VHDNVLRRLQRIIDDGQQAGVFRTDVPKRWLVTTAFSLMHAAAEEVSGGVLRADAASELLTKTLLSAFTQPAPRNAHDRP
jgi:TetR/AcrR family transcriptional regulator, mexCD-oprJ operon repressor